MHAVEDASLSPSSEVALSYVDLKARSCTLMAYSVSLQHAGKLMPITARMPSWLDAASLLSPWDGQSELENSATRVLESLMVVIMLCIEEGCMPTRLTHSQPSSQSKPAALGQR
jgi:hypothetical protein